MAVTLQEHGLIADGRAAALVASDGTVDWCCLPRFDHGSCFAALLDDERGGAIRLREHGAPLRGRQRYVEDTMVLETELRGRTGAARVTDALIRDGEPSTPATLVRIVEGLGGELELDLSVEVRFDYGQLRPWLRRACLGLTWAVGGDDGLLIWWDGGELRTVGDHDLHASARVVAGTRHRLVLRALGATAMQDPHTPPRADDVDDQVDATVAWWREQARQLPGGASALTRRSALVLRSLTYEPTGAIVAAPTTSLPEAPGGSRNWDYRYSWIRDSSFAVQSLAEVGFEDAARRFGRFALRSAAGHADELQVAFGVDGRRHLAERTVDLAGYEGARPVRVGNGASGQRQMDVLGELVRTTFAWHRRGESWHVDEWRFVRSLVAHAAGHWREPDRGLWEWRSAPRHFVHSKAACWAALDRGLRLAQQLDRQAPTERWAAERAAVRSVVLERGYDEGLGCFRQALDHDDLDAAALLLPVTGVVAWDDERMRSTADVLAERLDDDGLLRRYDADDGLPGREGAFLACAFWLAEAYARQGRLDRAQTVYDRVAATASPLGLFSEEHDTDHGLALGNYPQALTHLSQISAAVAIAAAAGEPVTGAAS